MQQPEARPLASIVGIAALIFALDQLTKYWVVQTVPLWESRTLIPGLDPLVQLTFITNTGAAFGMFPQLGGAFAVIAVVVIAGVLLFYHYLPVHLVWIRLSLGLQVGGAMGNLLDRFVHGYVVDFMDIGFWPIFNIADISIVCGVAILAYFLWQEEQEADLLSEGGKA